MNEKANPTMYDLIPVVSELNKVPGFNPLKFLRQTLDGPKLDLKIKKLWFRLKYPAGRTKLTALRITEQLAIIEAKVYFDKNDANPSGNVVAQAKAQDIPGGLYIEAAQHNALEQALDDAGFGIQFIPVGTAPGSGPVSVPKRETAVSAVVNEPAGAPVAAKQAAEVTLPVTAEETVQPPAQTTQSQAEMPVVEAATHIPDTRIAPLAETAEANEVRAGEVPITVEEPVIAQAEETEPTDVTSAYTADMPVDEICTMMTMEDAGNVIVPVGTCKGMTLSQVADRRPASLKWYLNGYSGDDNILRAGARLMLESISAMGKAS